MKLHVIIPIIDQIGYTEQAINSLSTVYPHCIHIIDQDSSQATQDWLKGKEDHERFWVHRYAPKVSLSQAWNTGVQEAMRDSDSAYFFIINNDVIFHPKTIDNLIDAMERTGYAMVTCNNVAPRVSEAEFKTLEPETDTEAELKPITNWREEGPDFSAFLITRQTIQDVGWFDENFYPAYYEDNDYHTRMLKAGKHAKRIARAPFYHYGSITARSTGVGAALSQSRYIDKWGAMPEQLMDGQGYKNPYNLPDKDWRFWTGCEKYV